MPEFIVECAKMLGLVVGLVAVVVTMVDAFLWTIQTVCRLIKWALWTVLSLLRAVPRVVTRAAKAANRHSYDEWFDSVRQMGAKAKDTIRTWNTEGRV